MKLYNGSAFKIENPKISTSGFYKDFGYGFYCTNIEKQAKRWAATRGKQHIVNVYSYVEDKNLNILKFDNMTEEWLDFVIDCRKGIEHEHDIVGGPMADDTIWDYMGLYRRFHRRQNYKRSILGIGKIQISYTSDCIYDR